MNSIKYPNRGFVSGATAETCRPASARSKMKPSMVTVSLLALLLSFAGCASDTNTSNTSAKPAPSVDSGPQTELKGRLVFDASPEQMYRIGNDRIRIVAEDEMTRFIKQAETNSFESGAFKARDLANIKALKEVTTDEDDTFQHALPAKGRVALVVEAKRRHKGEDGPAPKYVWIVWVTLEDHYFVRVTLNSGDALSWNSFFETSNVRYIKSL